MDWDVEHDLSRLVGDLAAHRLAEISRRAVGDPRAMARSLAESAAEFLQEEAHLLAARPGVAWFNGEVDELRDALARLQKRVACLERNQPRHLQASSR
jgi:ubiquinone biosynthesis protein UbiJ